MASLIVAADPTGVIGVDGKLPWHYPEDLKRFKQITLGGVLIMGSRTFKSLPGVLHGREIIVLSRQCLGPITGATVTNSLTMALEMSETLFSGKSVWIAGGAEVYCKALNDGLVDLIDFTEVPPVELSESARVTRLCTDFFEGFTLTREEKNAGDPRLTHKTYKCNSTRSKS